MANKKVKIIRVSIDALDVPGNVSLDEPMSDMDGNTYSCRMDYVEHNTGTSQTIWGTDPAVLIETLEELLK